MPTTPAIIEHFPTAGGIQKNPHHPHRPSINNRVVNLVGPYKKHLIAFSGGFGILSILILVIIIVVFLLYLMKKIKY
mgnify:CR=1 FL=1